MNSELETKIDAEEFLNSMDEWDTVFDPPVKCEYTEEQILDFAEQYAKQMADKELSPILSKIKATHGSHYKSVVAIEELEKLIRKYE